MQLAGFDLNLLVALEALLEEESVSRAAERLRVGQPAMSATLARLRDAFGDELLVRAGRGLRRTTFADSLRAPLTEVLHDLEQLLNSGTRVDPATLRRTFSVIAGDYIALILLRPLIDRLGALAPAVTVRVVPTGVGLSDRLQRGEADLAIYPAELLPASASLRRQPLLSDDFVCVVDRANPEVGAEITAEQLETLPYLALSQGGLPSLADVRLDEAQVPRNVAMVAESFAVAPLLLAGTHMYAFLGRRLARALIPADGFRILESPVAIPAVHEVMVWSPRRAHDSGHEWLREQLHQTAEALR